MKIKIKSFGTINKSEAKSSLKALEIFKATGGPVPKSVMSKVGKEASKATKKTGDSANLIEETDASIKSRQKGNSQRSLNNKPESNKLTGPTDKRKNKQMIRIKEPQSNGKKLKVRTDGTGFEDSQLEIPKL